MMMSFDFRETRLNAMNETNVELNTKYYQTLNEICKNWIQTLNDSVKQFDAYFDDIIKYNKENNYLFDCIQNSRNECIKEMAASLGIQQEDVAVCQQLIHEHHNQCKKTNDSMKSELNARKLIKSELSLETTNACKSIDSLKKKQQELIKQETDQNINEYKTMASVMRVLYKSLDNKNIVGCEYILVFNQCFSIQLMF